MRIFTLPTQRKSMVELSRKFHPIRKVRQRPGAVCQTSARWRVPQAMRYTRVTGTVNFAVRWSIVIANPDGHCWQIKPKAWLSVELVDKFSSIKIPNVHWQFKSMQTTALFRRAIGRNEAALASKADWVFFADCD